MVKTSVLNIKAKLNSNIGLDEALNSNITLMNRTDNFDIETDIAMSLALTSGLIQVNKIKLKI